MTDREAAGMQRRAQPDAVGGSLAGQQRQIASSERVRQGPRRPRFEREAKRLRIERLEPPVQESGESVAHAERGSRA